MNKHILIIQHYTLANRGDYAILKGMLVAIKHELCDISISSLSLTPELDSSLEGEVNFLPTIPPSINSFGEAIISIYTSLAFILVAFFRRLFGMTLVFLIPRGYRGVMETFLDADAVIGRSIDQLSDIFGSLVLWRSFYQICLGIILRKPMMLYAQTIGPIRGSLLGKLNRAILVFLLKKVQIITLREPVSKRFLKSLGIDNTILTADPSFLLDPSSSSLIRNLLLKHGVGCDKAPLVCIVPRHVTKVMINRYNQFLDILGQIADYLIQKHGYFIILVPQSYKKDYDNDFVAMKRLYKKIRNNDSVLVLLEVLNPSELKGIIKAADIVISSRALSTNFAISVATPVIGIDYALGKIEGFLEMAGMREYNCSWDNLSYNMLREKVEHLIKNQEQIKEKLTSASLYIKNRTSIDPRLLKMLLYKESCSSNEI